MATKRLKATTLIGIVLIGIISLYTMWQLRHVADGPSITFATPPQTMASALVAIQGTAERIDWLFLNNRQIFTDEAGHFKESLLLSPGYNILTIAGKDKFGRTTSKTIELNYQATSTNNTP